MTDQELASVILGITQGLDELYRCEPIWKKRGNWPKGETGSILYPPASTAEITALEKKLKMPLPPSYRRFLKLHNGWKHFWMDFSLLGAGGNETTRVLAEYKEAQDWQAENVKSDIGAFTDANVKKWEAADPSNLFLPKHLPLGTNFGGEWYFFDTRTRRADGEMTIVFWTLGYGIFEDPKYDSFEDLLHKVAIELETTLKPMKRKKPRK